MSILGMVDMLGGGSPLYVDLRSVCSGSNPVKPGWTGSTKWGDEYPCNLNAGSIVSAGILFTIVAMAVAGILQLLLARWPKGDEATAWGVRMNKLASLIKRGGTALFSSMAMYTMAFGIVIFLVILIVFSSRARADASDGIRLAAGYIVAVVVCLVLVLASIHTASESVSRAARAAMQMGGVSGSLRTAYSSGSVSSVLAIGLVFFFMLCYYLFMSLGRNRDAYSQYGNRCDQAGVFCGQTLGWRETTGYVFGVTTVAVLVRGMSGIFAKASEVGSELIFKLEPDQAQDFLRNPASIADKTGAVAVDSAGMLMDLIESVTFVVFAAEVLAQGHAPRMALPIWCLTATVLSGLVAYAFVRCSNAQVITVGERYRNMMWGLRIALYLCAILNIFVYAIATGILYRGYPSTFGGEKEGWYFFSCLLLGEIASIFVWESTSYFTATAASPTRSVAAAGITGAATMLIQGTGVGLISLLPTGLVLLLLLISCGAIAGNYGVAMGALGFVSLVWFVVAAACLAPVTYNADEACNQDETAAVREVTVSLFMCGESCASESRGWSAAASLLAGYCILAAFKQEAGLGPLMAGGTESDVATEGITFACAVAGLLTPLFIGGINVLAIGKATRALVDETRRQFQMLEGYTECNPEALSKVTCKPAFIGSVLPALLAMLLPCCIGFSIGARGLSLFVAGSLLGGCGLSVFFFNAGACWAKSKTSIEAEGAFGGSGADVHVSAVICTRAGGAFKDVLAPTLVSVSKTTAITSLLIAPLIFIDRNASYYSSCVNDRSVDRMSVFTCFDWNKSYWVVLPLVLALLVVAATYYLYWGRDGTPPQAFEHQPIKSRGVPPPRQDAMPP
eukprot:CAMPEP_0173423938 /NCGR_PEP_ID=MMETSP1357-20121228/4025_1 /TAXON_ID=77926 /ORGANISM="Hemiselmis rufescens, Strain PCC563" /LENGTH=850 /DNA_ID=CAMNT_0014387101 /DNA_START=63 /DNA_END=2612 /DNA_ORIENTATION=-